VLTNAQVRQALVAAGIPPAAIWPLSDSLYLPCLADWVTGDYHRWFVKARTALGIEAYEPESGDCDDAADLFATLARVAHRRTPEGKGAALPIGRINFSPSPAVYHAINWALTSDHGVIFPEPQVLFRVERLSVLQLASITRCSD
jgi:hypothetical protein